LIFWPFANVFIKISLHSDKFTLCLPINFLPCQNEVKFSFPHPSTVHKKSLPNNLSSGQQLVLSSMASVKQPTPHFEFELKEVKKEDEEDDKKEVAAPDEGEGDEGRGEDGETSAELDDMSKSTTVRSPPTLTPPAY